MTILERVWRLLPDRCEVVDCRRCGMRGNENVVGGKIVCDYCYARNGNLEFRESPLSGWRLLAVAACFGVTVGMLALMTQVPLVQEHYSVETR
jgi:hypothetical protein